MYSLGKLIGEGSDAEVYELLFEGEKTGEVIRFLKTDSSGLKTYLEPYINLHLSHENITRAKIVEIDEESGLVKFLYDKAYSDLSDFLRNTKLTRKNKLDICLSMAKGIAYLHSFGIIHCDIKPKNTLVFKKGDNYTIKITDFGLSRFDIGKTEKVKNLYTMQYKPPEVVKGENVSLKSDIWALGCSFYEIYYGEQYFTVENGNWFHEELSREKNKVNEKFNSLIRKMICDEKNRIDINDVCFDIVLDCKDCIRVDSKNMEYEEHIINLKEIADKFDVNDFELFVDKSLFLRKVNRTDSKQEEKICLNDFRLFDYIKN